MMNRCFYGMYGSMRSLMLSAKIPAPLPRAMPRHGTMLALPGVITVRLGPAPVE